MTPILSKNTRKLLKSPFWSILAVFFLAKLWLTYYTSSILNTCLESPHQGNPFRPPIWKQDWKFIFRLLLVFFFQNFILCENQKKQFLLEQKDTVWLFTSYGMELAPKTWKMLSSVQNEMPLWSGQARSGQVMQSYLDLKVHEKYSACHTEATYQISYKLGHRVQSNHCQSPQGI